VFRSATTLLAQMANGAGRHLLSMVDRIARRAAGRVTMQKVDG
jgi:DNA polymerase III gamma/tau subunit